MEGTLIFERSTPSQHSSRSHGEKRFSSTNRSVSRTEVLVALLGELDVLLEVGPIILVVGVLELLGLQFIHLDDGLDSLSLLHEFVDGVLMEHIEFVVFNLLQDSVEALFVNSL